MVIGFIGRMGKLNQVPSTGRRFLTLLLTEPIEPNECVTGSSQDVEFWSHGLEPITLVLDTDLGTSPVDA